MNQRWVYQVIEVKPGWTGGVKSQALQEELNRQGLQGWELVGLTHAAAFMSGVLIFKKPQ